MHSISGCLSDQETLSDEQIHQLLSDAEERLGSLQGKGISRSIATEEALARRFDGGRRGIR